MKPIHHLAIAALSLMAAGCRNLPNEVPSVLDVAVMTFNVRCGTAKDGDNDWTHRRELFCATVAQQAPDVLGVQEAFRFQLDDIRQALPGYGEVGEGRDGGVKGEYSAILYRTERFAVVDSGTFWLSDTPEVPSQTWGNACVRICTWARLQDRQTGQAFYLYNTHLDHKSQPSREKSVRLIAGRVARRAPDDPFVITGDFNVGEDNPALLHLLGKGEEASPIATVDSFRVLHPDAKEVGTFHGFRGGTNGAKIDYILVPPTTEVLAAEILHGNREGHYPSDHFPVTASLRFR